MTTDSSIKLAPWIQWILQSGFTLNADHLSYMASTFGTMDLAAIVEQVDHCELDSLLELIFSPDGDIRSAFEVRWGECRFSSHAASTISMRLTRTRIVTPIVAASGALVMHLELPDHVIAMFVQQLRIDWQPVPQLAKQLSLIADETQRTITRSVLRHAPLKWHPGQTDLVCRFLSKMPPGDERQTVWLQELVSLLSHLNPGQPIESFFLAKKAACLQALSQAEAFEARRRRQPMELLMMQGYRAAHGNVVHWREQMATIDRLSRLLFDRIPFVALPWEYNVTGEDEALNDLPFGY